MFDYLYEEPEPLGKIIKESESPDIKTLKLSEIKTMKLLRDLEPNEICRIRDMNSKFNLDIIMRSSNPREFELTNLTQPGTENELKLNTLVEPIER